MPDVPSLPLYYKLTNKTLIKQYIKTCHNPMTMKNAMHRKKFSRSRFNLSRGKGYR